MASAKVPMAVMSSGPREARNSGMSFRGNAL